MPSFLRVSVHFLLDEFDGRGDGGEPEWPPSPLRLFQALTNSAARLGLNTFLPSLEYLERLPPPLILASKPSTIQPRYGATFYVPNNDGDLWFNKADKSGGKRVEKNICPTRLPEKATVQYLWEIDADKPHRFIDDIQQLARSISAFGWGIDMVVADAGIIDPHGTCDISHHSEKWLPSDGTGNDLRVPIMGTLSALEKRHKAFLVRLANADDGHQYFRPVPPLESFQVVPYRREADLAHPPYAVFSLRALDDSKFATFDSRWRRLHLIGMLRHAASCSDFSEALGWDEQKVNSFVLGHDKSGPNHSQPTANKPRLHFIPLSSIEWRGQGHSHVGDIRRVLVTVRGYYDPNEFRQIVRAIEGRELIDEKQQQPIAFLRKQSEKDKAVSGYFSLDAASAVWTTVTPVVLPGHDDPRKLRRRLKNTDTNLSSSDKDLILRKLDERIERLLRKAFLDAGFPSGLVADADLEWRGTGFLPGVDLSANYSVPDQCRRFRRLHVRITWRERSPDGTLRPKKVAGPICIGSGRFAGLGLFVPTGS
jgi:CRISPR-associated protein Csb2